MQVINADLPWDNGVHKALDADCGGGACGCHVMVGNQWFALVNSAKSEELQTRPAPRQAPRHLSNQATNAMDYEVHRPEFQMQATCF